MRSFDALQVPSLDQYLYLRRLGFEVATGYTRAWTAEAIGAAKSVGLAVLPCIEAGNPTDPSYFTPARGRANGLAFTSWAHSVGMPWEAPFLDTVDCDFPADQLESVLLPYLNEEIAAVDGRNPLWLYGSWDVIDYAARRWGAVVGLMQAYAPAWSGGRNAAAHPLADVVQVRNSVVYGGVEMDLGIWRSAARLWR